ncbi:MAG: sulfite oxidase [Chloroflexi bacterium]|nr:sulfite oxidase [Chloroflexota bacterium]
MSSAHSLPDQQVKALWDTAEQAGVSRRRFLGLLAASGAAGLLAACVPKVSPTPTPATPTPTPAARPISKPTPEQFFIPLGTNAEMRFEVMANQAYTTPEANFFVRSHTSTPSIDIKTWRLNIEGDGVANPLQLTYDDLLKMPARTVTRFVECAGNGRSFFATLMDRPAEGGQWRLGAYGVAEWTGVPLSDILNRAGIKSSAVDVMPTGLDSTRVERPMPAAKAMEEDTIVAYLMNGGILPPDHGFPVRLITPGWVGINNIKWVGKITVSEKPLFVEKNTASYVFIGPDYPPKPPAKGPALTTQVLKSACALPWPATLRPGPQKIAGYAWSPFGKISRVEVSLDKGKTFQEASLVGPNIERAGSRWEFSLTAQPGALSLTPRATDDKGNSQYDVPQQKWNQLGYLFGATVPHPVEVTG